MVVENPDRRGATATMPRCDRGGYRFSRGCLGTPVSSGAGRLFALQAVAVLGPTHLPAHSLTRAAISYRCYFASAEIPTNYGKLASGFL